MSSPATPPSQRVRLVQGVHSQIIEIPSGFELPGDEVTIRRDGGRLIVEPVPTMSLAELLDSWEPLDEEFPEIDDPPSSPEDIF